jgi:hypothetical protein
MLAWKVQEEAFGGHDAATQKLLKAFACKDADKVVLFRKLKPGTTVVREYQASITMVFPRPSHLRKDYAPKMGGLH